MKLAPIILFVYNRPWHTRKTVEALKKNRLSSHSDLIIYSDGPSSGSTDSQVSLVREFIRNITGFGNIKIVEREKNFGLSKSVIDGVTEVIGEYGKVIVLEDDIITSHVFLDYMNDALENYEDNGLIGSVTAFNFPSWFTRIDEESHVFLNVRPMSWSWGTWLDRWKSIDWELDDYQRLKRDKRVISKLKTGGTDLPSMLELQMKKEIDSWYVRFSYNLIMSDKYTVYPRISYANNIGHDGTGVHCGDSRGSIFAHEEISQSLVELPKDLVFYTDNARAFNKGFDKRFSLHKSLLRLLVGERVYNAIKIFISKSIGNLDKKHN